MKTYYLIERLGDTRSIWPAKGDSLYAAQKQAGKRHGVFSGETLAGRRTITADALRTLVRTGSVRIEDGAHPDHC
jgi:hypothetical protein